MFQHYDNILVSSVFDLGNYHVIIVNHVTILTRRLYVVSESRSPSLQCWTEFLMTSASSAFAFLVVCC